MFAAEQQLEAANGPNDTPFVTVKVTVDDKMQAVVEAFQVLSLFNRDFQHFTNLFSLIRLVNNVWK
jgi:hypothetical protein